MRNNKFIYHCFVFLLLLFFDSKSQNISEEEWIKVREDNVKIDISKATYYFLDPSGKATITDITKNNPFLKNNHSNVNFGSSNAYLWLKFGLVNTFSHPKKLSFITKGVDSLTCYQVNSEKKIISTIMTGSHINYKKREYQSSMLVTSFVLAPNSTQFIYLRAKNTGYSLSVSPYLLMSYKEASILVKRRDLIQSIYIGSMFFLLMFGVALLLFFKERLYIYYLICVFFNLTLMVIYNEYYFLFIDTAPLFIRNKNLLGSIASILPVFYLLFTKEFLIFGYDNNGTLRRIIRTTIGVTLTIIFCFIFFQINFYEYRRILYIFLFSLCGLNLILLYRSIVRKYKPAWFYLIATFPVLFVGFLEALSDLHRIPIQDLHLYYYITTLIEMYILLLGLAYKFKITQDEKEKIQIVVLGIESQAQEQERRRIAQDLHDSIGGLLSLLKLHLNTFLKKAKLQGEEIKEIKDIFKVLDNTADSVRSISHSLAPSTLTKLGLVPAIFEMYQHIDEPKFTILVNGFKERLELNKEMALYYIIQECVSNIQKHAQAKEVSIQFNQVGAKISVNIEDDGIGFDTSIISKGKGLENINVRVKEHLKGDIVIDSTPGNGTIVMIKMKV
jgi:signal transduction histidine kinase